MNSLFMRYSALIIPSPLLNAAQVSELTLVNGSSIATGSRPQSTCWLTNAGVWLGRAECPPP